MSPQGVMDLGGGGIDAGGGKAEKIKPEDPAVAVLADAITADTNLQSVAESMDDEEFAAYLNEETTTDIWKPFVTVAEMAVVVDWTAFSKLSVQLQNTYFALTQTGIVDSTQAPVRDAFVMIFGANSGTAAGLMRLFKRKATRYELLAVTGDVSAKAGEVCTAAIVSNALRGG